MNILEAVLNAQNGGAAREAGRAVGLSQEGTASALSALIPQLAAALHRNASQPGGLDALLGALGGGQHTQYVDDVTRLGRGETVDDGNAILGHILGSKDASRAVAARAASQTGLDAAILKKLLPLAATMVMGSLAKQSGAQVAAGNARAGLGDGAGLFGMLTPLLDQNRDGSMLDDISRSVGKMFGGDR
jgi:hypothetical protein